MSTTLASSPRRRRLRRALVLLAGVGVATAALTAAGTGAASAGPSPESTATSATTSATTRALDPDALVSSTGRVVTPQQAATALAFKGAVPRGSNPSPGRAHVSGGMTANSVIGSDDRFQVLGTTSYPFSATVLIRRNGALHCTGWMISKDTMLTAGHCVHTGGTGGSWYSGLTFTPGSNGGTAPFGTYTSRGTWALNGWLNSASSDYDAAIVKLSSPVGSSTGWYGMWWQSAALDGLFTRVTGYPGDKPSTQWMSYDQVRASQTYRIFYDNDTTGGNSGSRCGSTAARRPPTAPAARARWPSTPTVSARSARRTTAGPGSPRRSSRPS
ncbi:trypsin-like serine peptidase [Lapillicoccus jejuensis]|uniref:Serine protease n=1 Tax=Lapillicoccus jejuensis TaxID=402171 RepID=A0A542E6L7_9MICO|nr:trypsin-like serine protease [Lapillicoccus jejuensis]TQJ10954.1 glutamyl endopeptidase [Lapillicoccus jejuensis]